MKNLTQFPKSTQEPLTTQPKASKLPIKPSNTKRKTKRYTVRSRKSSMRRQKIWLSDMLKPITEAFFTVTSMKVKGLLPRKLKR